MATAVAPLPTHVDKVEFLGKPDYTYRVTREFPDSPAKRIAVTVPPNMLSPYIGSFAWPEVERILIKATTPYLDYLTALQ